MSNQIISEQEILNVQKAWGEGIIKIGKVFQEGGDYSATGNVFKVSRSKRAETSRYVSGNSMNSSRACTFEMCNSTTESINESN